MIDICEYAKKNNIYEFSAVGCKEFREFFETIKINIAVEIGTHKGMGASYIAQFANKVYTFDVVDYLEKYKAWYELKISNKIYFYTIKSRDVVDGIFKNIFGEYKLTGRELNIEPILNAIEFDFAFIDGNHTYRDVRADWEAVKKCGRVLFHDVASHFEGVRKFAKEIGVKINGNTGYWEK